MKTISLKVSQSLDRRLAERAVATGVSKSELARRALDAYLARDHGADVESAADRAGDLVGCLAGPRDLSSNTDYLDGYGK